MLVSASKNINHVIAVLSSFYASTSILCLQLIQAKNKKCFGVVLSPINPSASKNQNLKVKCRGARKKLAHKN